MVTLFGVVHPVVFTGDLCDHAQGGFVADFDLHSKPVVTVWSKVIAIESDAVAFESIAFSPKETRNGSKQPFRLASRRRSRPHPLRVGIVKRLPSWIPSGFSEWLGGQRDRFLPFDLVSDIKHSVKCFASLRQLQ
ncbi:MAG: hypothetical protein ACI9R3_005081 [Verrucomicrobiales bacterium]